MSEPKERPILMQPDMALAVRKYKKTETRRLTGLKGVNHNPDDWFYTGITKALTPSSYYRIKRETLKYPMNMNAIFISQTDTMRTVISPSATKLTVGTLYALFQHKSSKRTVYIPSPYGCIGERLWVRETRHLLQNGEYRWASQITEEEMGKRIKSTPSIHLKRSDAALFLNVLEARVERLNKISRASAIAEGVILKDKKQDPVETFKDLICGIHGENLWEKNPFVWVVRFKKVRTAKKSRKR